MVCVSKDRWPIFWPEVIINEIEAAPEMTSEFPGQRVQLANYLNTYKTKQGITVELYWLNWDPYKVSREQKYTGSAAWFRRMSLAILKNVAWSTKIIQNL